MHDAAEASNGQEAQTGDKRDDHAEAPLVSIVIPTHISEPPFLAETLASVVAQDWPYWEVIVVDDGSPDPQALQRLTAIDERIAVARHDGGGAARSRNVGLGRARGELVAFLDYDDVWYPGHLSTAVATLREHPDAVGSYTAFDVVKGPEKDYVGARHISGPTTRHTVFSGGNRPGITTLVARTDAVRAVGGFDPGAEGAEDVDLVFKLVERAPFVYVDAVTVAYRVHDHNWSRDTRGVAAAGDHVIAAHQERLSAAGDIESASDLAIARRIARQYYAGAALRDAFAAAKAGHAGQAAALLWWGVRFSPSGAISMATLGPARRLARIVRTATAGASSRD